MMWKFGELNMISGKKKKKSSLIIGDKLYRSQHVLKCRFPDQRATNGLGIPSEMKFISVAAAGRHTLGTTNTSHHIFIRLDFMSVWEGPRVVERKTWAVNV